MRRIADEKGVDLLVVDSGDRSEGNGLYDASDPKGVYTRRILRQADHYDLLTSGNHELYNGTTSLNEWKEMVPYFGVSVVGGGFCGAELTGIGSVSVDEYRD